MRNAVGKSCDQKFHGPYRPRLRGWPFDQHIQEDSYEKEKYGTHNLKLVQDIYQGTMILNTSA